MFKQGKPLQKKLNMLTSFYVFADMDIFISIKTALLCINNMHLRNYTHITIPLTDKIDPVTCLYTECFIGGIQINS